MKNDIKFHLFFYVNHIYSGEIWLDFFITWIYHARILLIKILVTLRRDWRFSFVFPLLSLSIK
jgi:hypothetical protein